MVEKYIYIYIFLPLPLSLSLSLSEVMAAINGDRVHAIAVEEEGMDGNKRYCEGLHIEEGTEPPVSVVAADLNSRRSRAWSFSLSLCFIQKVTSLLSILFYYL